MDRHFVFHLIEQDIGLPSDFREYSIEQKGLDATVVAIKMDPAALNYPLPPELIKAVGECVIHSQKVSV